MNTQIVPERKESHFSTLDKLLFFWCCVLVLLIVAAIIGFNWHTWGETFTIFVGVFVGLPVLAKTAWVIATAIHDRYLHHKDRTITHQHTTMQLQLAQQAMAMGHSVEMTHTDHLNRTHQLRTISPLTIPNAPITIKELNFGQEQEQLSAPLPGPLDLSHLLETWQPDGRNILLGLGPGEQRITVPIKSLCHVALAGATGGGKSMLMRLLLPQILTAGCSVALADPHYAPVDPENGEDWRPIASRLALEPAVRYGDIGDLLGWLAYEELPKRLELRRQSQQVGKPYFLALDELPAICSNIKQAPDAMATLLREGRKVNILLISAAQDWLVKTIGGTGAVRDCFRTAFYVGGDTTSARVLLDVTGRVDDGGLGKGVVMLRSVATPQAALTRIPKVDNKSLCDLLEMPASTPLHNHYNTASGAEIIEADGNTALPTLDARSQRIREMILARSKPKQIIEEIWKTSGGSSYIKASDELTEITATLLERGEI